MSYQWQLNGLVNTDSKELIVEASGPGPNGGKMKFREINQFNSADSITIIAQMQMDEKWTTFMTTHLTRTKATASSSPGK